MAKAAGARQERKFPCQRTAGQSRLDRGVRTGPRPCFASRAGRGHLSRRQAYRQAVRRGESDLSARNAAADVALRLGRPNDGTLGTVSVVLDWAIEQHREWFYAYERP